MDLEVAPPAAHAFAAVPRWELYRLLSDPVRVRLLALVSLEELAVGELAELLSEGAPKVSRHGAALRDAGVVSARRNGTSVLLRLDRAAARDAVVEDAIRAGLALIEAEGTRARVDEVIRARDAKSREYFARAGQRREPRTAVAEHPSYLRGLSPLLPRRSLAVDAGTGDGALLEVLCPLFEQVIAVDRSALQLKQAEVRGQSRGFDNVRFLQAELDDAALERAVRGASSTGADLVFCSRVLHHAPQPERAVARLASLLAPPAGGPGGALVILDYAAHDDLEMREAHADLWLGFELSELERFALAAGLSPPELVRLPRSFRGDGPDAHLAWVALFARRTSP